MSGFISVCMCCEKCLNIYMIYIYIYIYMCVCACVCVEECVCVKFVT